MADFPPNLEDGEKWLPSDIYHEIVYGSFDPKPLADNTRVEGAAEVENHGGNGVLTEQSCLWQVPRYGEERKGFARSSGGTGVFLPQAPLIESTRSNLPSFQKKTRSRGTGVFLQTFASKEPAIVQKSKKSGKNGKAIAAANKGTPEKKDVSSSG